ncbi:MAG: hypothetical protein KDK08_13350 [Rhizobiaceae bacterium]|nr:hypothetical protein [Rhizobiaceae bacterium]
MNRRSLLKTAPAVALVACVPLPAAAAETPVMRLYRRYVALSDAASAHISTTADEDAELDRLFYNERDRIENEMFALPSQTPQDMAAKMLVVHSHGEQSCLDFDGMYRAEARALVA